MQIQQYYVQNYIEINLIERDCLYWIGLQSFCGFHAYNSLYNPGLSSNTRKILVLLDVFFNDIRISKSSFVSYIRKK